MVTKAAPKVESLVLQGGGGKGVGYPPMLEEMEKSGMLASVDLWSAPPSVPSTPPASPAAVWQTNGRSWS